MFKSYSAAGQDIKFLLKQLSFLWKKQLYRLVMLGNSEVNSSAVVLTAIYCGC